MSKNITIQEGGVGKQLTVDKLKTNLVGGGTCLWVPEDEVAIGPKTITENGVFVAADDGLYGYSQVAVNSVGIAMGKMPLSAPTADGNEYAVSSGMGGDLEFTKLPALIKVTTLPTTHEYNDGDTIDYTGMVVTAYDANNSSMGTIPLSELTLSVTEADSGSAYYEEWSDGAGVNTRMLTYTPRWFINWQGNEEVVYCSEVVGTRNDLPAMLGDKSGPTQFLITRYNGDIYCMGSTAKRYLNGYTYDASAERSNYRLFLGTNANTGTGPVENNGKLLDFATDIPVSTAEPTDNTELHPEQSGKQTIPVKWARPFDGKVLETSFEITVLPTVDVPSAE